MNRIGHQVVGSIAVIAILAYHEHALSEDAVADTYPPIVQGNVNALALDPEGNKYVGGWFSGTRDFNPGPGEDSRTSAGGKDAFVTKFTANGAYAWTQTFGGSGDEEMILALAFLSGRVYAAGGFDSSDAGVGGTGSIASNGGGDAFVLALDASDGSPVATFSGDGVYTMGGSDNDQTTRVTVFDGNIYATGWYQSSDAGLGGSPAHDKSEVFVVCLSSSGSPVGTFGNGGFQTFGGSEDDRPRGIMAEGGVLYATGFFRSSNAGIGGTGTVATQGGADFFVVALDAETGAAMPNFGSGGVQTFGGSGDDVVGTVTSYGGALFVAGFYSDGAKFPGGSSISSRGGFDGCVLALNAYDGDPIADFGGDGVVTFGGTGDDRLIGMAARGGKVASVGYSYSTSGGIDGGSGFDTQGLGDAAVVVLNASDGSADAGFDDDGIQSFGGTSEEAAYSVQMDSTYVWIAGEGGSTDALVGGTGTSYDFTGFSGFVLPLDRSTGETNQPPETESDPTAIPNPVTLTP